MPLKKVKFVFCVICLLSALAAGLFFYFRITSSSKLLSALPKPLESSPYVLMETKDGSYPKSFSAILTDGLYALLRSGTSRNCLLAVAASARDCAVLVEEMPDGMTEVYAALRFSESDMRALKKGQIPDAWENLKGADITPGRAKDDWILRIEDVDGALYYRAERGRIIIAADEAPFKRLLSVRNGEEDGLGAKKWKDEPRWRGHMEICDGGLLFKDGTDNTAPLKLQTAWQDEIKWSIEGLDKKLGEKTMRALKARKWDTADCVIPTPLLLSMGVNIPDVDGSPDDWPFPLKTLGEFGRTMQLKDGDIRAILSGQTILSLGGQNQILWFTLPGFMIEFTADTDILKRLVSAYWEKLFFGAEPKPLDGFTYGGTTNMPFSVIGAGRDNLAILGLASPESIKNQDRLGKFLNDDEEAIGWMIADLPRLGAALSDMTRMNSFMNDGADTDEPYFDDMGPNDEAFQPDMSFSPFDQGISDSFGNILKKFGKVLIVWEKPDSGRIRLYNTNNKQH